MSKVPVVSRALLLVCKACSQRGSGPKTLKSKELARELAGLAKDLRGSGTAPRPRVLLTSCQGLCPKRAIAVTATGHAGPARVHVCSARSDAAAVIADLVPDAMAPITTPMSTPISTPIATPPA